MDFYPFDSRNLQYRSKIGAVAAGETLRLRLLLHFDARVTAAFLRIRLDGQDEWQQKMEPVGTVENFCVFETAVTLDTGLYWYSFRYESEHSEFFVAKRGSKGIYVREPEDDWWQQTVYDADFKTPDWLSGGLIYQIFPDRFYRSGKSHAAVPDDRYLCTDWNKQPEYRQNGELCRLGNDYYGGDLAGISQKLPYLQSLGVTCIYLNPIFEAHSNHRYNTADYLKIDPLLGNKSDLQNLCRQAKKYGISVILDGVFSHTGDDSVYFNRYGRYDTAGAYQSTASPYFSWYTFSQYPDQYSAWWGIPSLPETNENNPSFSEHITGENGVLRTWMRCGVAGWRLDVADELPDAFLDAVRMAVKAENPDAYVLGEVWEDASNKISYGHRRRFLQGRQLDSVMNYPFANAIINFVCGGRADAFSEQIESVLEHYPPQCVKLLMNHIGTHDTARILTRLIKGDAQGDRAWQAAQRLTAEEYAKGVCALKAAAVLQYTLPGVPSLYYGDEVGMQGFGDPFCRGAFPWENEDADLLEFYRALGQLRHKETAFCGIGYCVADSRERAILYLRDGILVGVNCGEMPVSFALPDDFSVEVSLFGKPAQDGKIVLKQYEFCIIKKAG